MATHDIIDNRKERLVDLTRPCTKGRYGCIG
jgi:hypothetical protein